MRDTSPTQIPPQRAHGAIEPGAPRFSQKQTFRLPERFQLSVVVPVFNEQTTLPKVVERIRATQIPCEVILVDDGSTDGSRELIQSWRDMPDVVVELHATNRGKGAALQTGFRLASGQAVIVQDADLEYDPDDYWALLRPMLADEADVVFGSRFAAPQGDRSPFWHRVLNKLLTAASNAATGLSLTDMETCYKLMRRDVLMRVLPDLRETGFGIEPELTARLARLPGVRIGEAPIRYQGRTYAAGKKIRATDGVWALWCIFWYGLLRR